MESRPASDIAVEASTNLVPGTGVLTFLEFNLKFGRNMILPNQYLKILLNILELIIAITFVCNRNNLC